MAEPEGDERPTTEIAQGERPTAAMAEPAGAAIEADGAATVAIPTSPKKSRVLVFLVTLLALSVVGPLVFYFGFWRFEPTAQFHVPAGTTIAVRFDARELYLYPPFRERVLPLLLPKSDDRTKPTKPDQVRSETGIDLGNDLREIVVATSDGRSVVALFGGRFLGARRGRFIEGFEHAMEKEPAVGEWTPVGDVLAGPNGVGVAQADDGTLVLATSVDLAKASLPATDDYRDLWLASSGAISFSIQRAALQHYAAANRGAMPEAAVFDKLERVTGWITLGEYQTKIAMELALPMGEPSEVVTTEALAFAAAATKKVDADPDLAVLKPLLTNAQLKARANGVMVNVTLKGAEAEAMVGRLATFVEAARALH